MTSVHQRLSRFLVAIFFAAGLAFAPAVGGLVSTPEVVDVTLSGDIEHGTSPDQRAMADCQLLLTCLVTAFKSPTTDVGPIMHWTQFVPSPLPSDLLVSIAPAVEPRPPKL